MIAATANQNHGETKIDREGCAGWAAAGAPSRAWTDADAALNCVCALGDGVAPACFAASARLVAVGAAAPTAGAADDRLRAD